MLLITKGIILCPTESPTMLLIIKGRLFYPHEESHDVADKKGAYRDYPTMFMKTIKLAFALIPLTERRRVRQPLGPSPIAQHTKRTREVI
jgi:hypothetical protein